MNPVPLQQVAVGDVRTPLLVLMGAAAFVLLIGCANVGNLVLVRGIARRRELAVRSPLGAGVGRLVRQLLTESCVLALLASLLGSTLAFWGSELLVAALSQRFALPPVTFDWPLLALAVLIALLSGVLCGLPLALLVSKSRLSGFLKEGSRSHAGGRTGEPLAESAGDLRDSAHCYAHRWCWPLLLKSFFLLHQTDLGLNPRNVLMAELLLSKRYADPQRREIFQREMLESVGGLPGVQQVAVHTDPPFQGGGSRETFRVEGHPDPGPRQGHAAAFNVVSSGFFGAMGIPIKRGRVFDQRDARAGAPVVIVNETMARGALAERRLGWQAGHALLRQGSAALALYYWSRRRRALPRPGRRAYTPGVRALRAESLSLSSVHSAAVCFAGSANCCGSHNGRSACDRPGVQSGGQSNRKVRTRLWC